MSSSSLPDPGNDNGNKSDNKNDPDDGQALASQFYQQVRQNEQQQARQLPKEEGSNNKAQFSQPSQNQFSGRPAQQQQPPSPIKFTGALGTGGARPSLFSPETGDSGANSRAGSSNNSPAVQREREREFNLVGNFERTLGIQAVVLAASLAFVIGVGVTGGITDGSDRDFGGYDEIESGVINQVYFSEDWSSNDGNNRLLRQPAAPEQPNQQEQDGDGRSVWL